MIDRVIDIAISIIGLLLLAFLFPWIGLLIKLDSKGKVIYACDRVGLDGKIFRMYKFRTMYDFPVNLGPSISPQGDPRVTTVGRLLRRLKLNEFPQFINVLKGEMTLIGPRPEAPDLAAAYPDFAKKVFSVKPGLAGPNQILGRNEEELYPPGVDPVKYYINYILPRKLPLDLEYISDKSVFKNLKYLFLSIKATITGAVNRRHLLDNRSQIYLMVTDAILCLLSFSLAHYLRFDSFSDYSAHRYLHRLLPWIIVIRMPVFIFFGFYHTLIRHFSFYDVKIVIKGVAVSSLLLISFSFLWGHAISGYSRGVFLIDWFALSTLLVGYRAFLKKLYLKYKAGTPPENRKRVLIWGAGDAGELCLLYLQKNKRTSYEVIGFIDDEPAKRHRRLNGVKILGDRHHLEILTKLYKIQEVFLAIHSAPEAELNRAMEICRHLGLEAKLFMLEAMSCNGLAPERDLGPIEPTRPVEFLRI